MFNKLYYDLNKKRQDIYLFNIKIFQERKFGNALVVGISRYPRKVTRKDFANKKKFERRTTVKPFVKYVNLNHLMPTR